MDFISPGWLFGIAPIVAVALWTIFKPARQRVVVPSLSLWQQALELAGVQSTSKTRKINLPWILFLLGAVCMLLALIKPQFASSKPSRKVAIILCASAENSTPAGLADLRKSARKLLNRLSPVDQVKLILTSDPPGEHAEFLSPMQAADQLARLAPVPVKLRDINWLSVPQDTQQVFVISAGSKLLANNQTQIFTAANLPALTISQASVSDLTETTQALFARLANNSASPVVARVSLRKLMTASPVRWEEITPAFEVEIAPGKSASLVRKFQAPYAKAIAIQVAPADLADSKSPARVSFVRAKTDQIAVAIIGQDQPFLRKYIQADDRLSLISDPALADVIFANREDVPVQFPLKPALLIATPKAGPGWALSGKFENVPGDQVTLIDDPVTKNLSFKRAAFRNLTAAIPGDFPTGKAVATYNKQAVICRSTPEKFAYDTRRWVYLGFGLDSSETNLPTSPEFVVLLSNCVDYLTANMKKASANRWVSRAPGFADASTAKQISIFPRPKITTFEKPGLFYSPGDPSSLDAVNLLEVEPFAPKSTVDSQILQAKLPEAKYQALPVELSWLFACVGLASWLFGWWLNLKR